MTKLNLKTYVDALLETSSVAAHDISGQVHVMQFCVEELGEHVSEDGKKYLSKLQDSLDELTDVVSFYRTYIKKAALSGTKINSTTLIEKVLASVKVNFWNESKLVNFSSLSKNEDWNLSVSCAEAHSVIYSLVALYLEELKKGQIEAFVVRVGLIKLDSQYCQFTLDSSIPVNKEVFEVLDSSPSPGAKAFRKNLGHDILLNSPVYDLSVTTADNEFKIILNMKVLDE